MNKALHPRNDTENMRQEKNKKEDLLALRFA